MDTQLCHHCNPTRGIIGRRQRTWALPLAAALASLLVGLPAHATVTNTWTFAGTSDWHTVSNWLTAGLPSSAGDVANLPSSSSRSATIKTSVTVGMIKAGGSGNFTVTMGSGGSLTFNSGTSDKAWLQQLAGGGRCGVTTFSLGSDLDVVNSGSAYFDVNGITGSYDIHVNRTTGTGTPYFGGNNPSFTGNWHIHGGTLMYAQDPFGNTSSGTRTITIYNNAALRRNGNSPSSNRRIVIGTGGGKLMPNGGSLVLATADQLAGSGTLTITDASGVGTVALNAANDSFTGAVIVGTGTLAETFALGAAGSINNSPMILLTNNVATLIVTNKPAGYSVPAGQTIAGIGTVLGRLNVSTTGARVHPGNYALPSMGANPGILTVSNGLNIASGGAYLWDLKTLKDDTNGGVAGTDFGKLDVTAGAVSLSGGVLTLNFVGTAATTGPSSGNAFWKTDHTWTILTATGAPTGTLTVSNGVYPDGEFRTQVSGNTLQLTYGRPIRATTVIVR